MAMRDHLGVHAALREPEAQEATGANRARRDTDDLLDDLQRKANTARLSEKLLDRSA